MGHAGEQISAIFRMLDDSHVSLALLAEGILASGLERLFDIDRFFG